VFHYKSNPTEKTIIYIIILLNTLERLNSHRVKKKFRIEKGFLIKQVNIVQNCTKQKKKQKKPKKMYRSTEGYSRNMSSPLNVCIYMLDFGNALTAHFTQESGLFMVQLKQFSL
jgi:hypothetical protein